MYGDFGMNGHTGSTGELGVKGGLGELVSNYFFYLEKFYRIFNKGRKRIYWNERM